MGVTEYPVFLKHVCEAELFCPELNVRFICILHLLNMEVEEPKQTAK